MNNPCEHCQRASCPESCKPLLDFRRHLKKINPCWHCENRAPGCHGNCAAYTEWRQIQDAITKKIQDGRRDPTTEYVADRVIRRPMNKRWRKP